MKKRNILGALVASVCLIAGNIVPASADALRVVTLGADLSAEQQQTMLNYFKVNANEVEIMYITNADEREHLSAYVPLEQIGTRTVSCAYVRPTQSGGIKVRTANLNWVTGNMIASTLSTSGVKNCEVIAACPFEVSGTGALTGIQMAYEKASGEELDPVKKQIATEEMVVTGNLADEVGKADATTVITQAKMQVIEGNIQDADEIYNIVVDVADINGVSITEDEIQRIVGLLVEIAQQNYDYEEMRETLERVDENITSGEPTEETEEEYDEDSIMTDIDESVLGEDILATSTEDSSLEAETSTDSDSVSDEDLWDEVVEGETTEGELEEISEGETQDTTDEAMEVYEETTESTETTDSGEVVDDVENVVNPAEVLSEQNYAMYQKLEKFCVGEFEGDMQALVEVMGDDAIVSVVLKPELGAELSKKIKDIYLDILMNGTGDFTPDGTEKYISAELNVMNNKLKEIFTIEGSVLPEGEEDILVNLGQEDRELLYDDIIKFFEKLYGEESFEEVYVEGTDENASEVYEEVYETSDEVPYEEVYDEDYYTEEYYE